MHNVYKAKKNVHQPVEPVVAVVQFPSGTSDYSELKWSCQLADARSLLVGSDGRYEETNVVLFWIKIAPQASGVGKFQNNSPESLERS